MPQLLSEVVHGSRHIRHLENYAEKQPEISALVGNAISLWSLIEYRLRAAVITLWGEGVAELFSEYKEKRNATSQVKFMKKVAQSKLDDDDKKLFSALCTLYTTHSDQRHKFSHWIRAYCEEAPSHLILIETRLVVDTDAMFMASKYGLTINATSVSVSDYECYSIEEIKRIVSVFYSIADLFGKFNFMINPFFSEMRNILRNNIFEDPLMSAEVQ